jgi:hypothetical protein
MKVTSQILKVSNFGTPNEVIEMISNILFIQSSNYDHDHPTSFQLPLPVSG